MFIEKMIHTRGLRIKLILQSADVETHSIMSDAPATFNTLSENMQEYALSELNAILPEEGVKAKR